MFSLILHALNLTQWTTPIPSYKSKSNVIQEPPLPRPFELPQNFPQAITIALRNKKLTGKPRAKLLLPYPRQCSDTKANQLMINIFKLHKN